MHFDGLLKLKEITMLSNDVRFNWLRDKGNNPVAVVASRPVEQAIRYAIAIYNPNDRFNKVVGRQIAEGRLNFHQKEDGLVGFVASPISNVKQAILTNIMKTDELPKHVRDAAKYRITLLKLKETA
jgi:hypothetical protein